MDILSLINAYLTGQGTPTMQPPPVAPNAARLITMRQGLNSMLPRTLPVGMSDMPASMAGYGSKLASAASKVTPPPLPVSAAGGAAAVGGAAALGRYALNSIPGIAATIAAYFMQKRGSEYELAEKQEGQSLEGLIQTERKERDMRKNINAGNIRYSTRLPDAPAPVADRVPMNLADYRQTGALGAPKMSGMQRMFDLDARIGSHKLSPIGEKKNRAKYAARLIKEYPELDPITVGMWVQGGSSAFEELSKQRSAEEIAGVRSEKTLSMADKLKLLQEKADRDSSREMQRLLQTEFGKAVGPTMGTRMPWKKRPQDVLSAFQQMYPGFTPGGGIPQVSSDLPASGGKLYSSLEEAEAAAAKGTLKSGERVVIAGQSGIWE